MSQLRITKQSSDVRQGIAVRTVGTFLIRCLVMAGCVIPITAQDRGNTTAQEYGDAVYRVLASGAGWDLDYNHTGAFRRLRRKP